MFKTERAEESKNDEDASMQSDNEEKDYAFSDVGDDNEELGTGTDKTSQKRLTQSRMTLPDHSEES